MKPFIFIGPTLSVSQAQKQLDAVYLPPVKYGDVYRITQLYQPQVIGIVDGYFNQVPAVWHKEILWAIHQGVNVFGASSMGALRAAELESLGMSGCGKIFEAYKKGVLPPYVDEAFEDDDEVAVTHGPAEMGYKPLSEAMVNIRFSLARAYQENIIDRHTRDELIKIAKAMFYPKRNYETVLHLATQQGLANSQASDLNQWLKDNKSDQKKTDALTLLKQIKTHQSATQTNSNNHTFVQTSQWQGAINEIDRSHRIEHRELDELRLQGQRYFEQLQQALNAAFVHDHTDRHIDADELTALHQSTQAMDTKLSQHWQQLNNQAMLGQFSVTESDQCLLRYLQQTGEFDALQQRAKHKKQALKTKQLPQCVDLSDLDLLQLTDWYFSECLNMDIPAQLEDYAARLGFTEMDSFYDMILREYYYKQEL